MSRWKIWWASLPEAKGSGPGYRRPILIVQADEFNRSKINTVLAAILTSNLLLASAPGNVLLKARASGLPRDSVVNVSQLITVDKRFLTDKVKTIDPFSMQRVDAGL
ncbi:MAG: type II toxin-antitoxin system PemK/MazF family toxin [bacterium]